MYSPLPVFVQNYTTTGVYCILQVMQVNGNTGDVIIRSLYVSLLGWRQETHEGCSLEKSGVHQVKF